MFYRVLGIRIDNLDQELKEMYLELALFMEDVNIRPEMRISTYVQKILIFEFFLSISLVLCRSKLKKNVIDIMRELEKKHLVHMM